MIVDLSSLGRANLGDTIDMKLEDQIRDTMRFKHLSLRTEDSYVGWYRRYVLWHGKTHPEETGADCGFPFEGCGLHLGRRFG